MSKKPLLPIATRVAAKTMALDIIRVQPISAEWLHYELEDAPGYDAMNYVDIKDKSDQEIIAMINEIEKKPNFVKWLDDVKKYKLIEYIDKL